MAEALDSAGPPSAWFEHAEIWSARSPKDVAGDLVVRLAQVETRLGDVKADLMKWSFVFWVGAVGAIAALAGVLR